MPITAMANPSATQFSVSVGDRAAGPRRRSPGPARRHRARGRRRWRTDHLVGGRPEPLEISSSAVRWRGVPRQRERLRWRTVGSQANCWRWIGADRVASLKSIPPPHADLPRRALPGRQVARRHDLVSYLSVVAFARTAERPDRKGAQADAHDYREGELSNRSACGGVRHTGEPSNAARHRSSTPFPSMAPTLRGLCGECRTDGNSGDDSLRIADPCAHRHRHPLGGQRSQLEGQDVYIS